MTTGWRVATLGPTGLVRNRKDRHGSPLLWASCDLLPHDAPDEACSCGYAIVLDLRDLLEALEYRPWTLELHPLQALQRGRGLLDALRTGHCPDLLAYCTSLGDEQPAASRHDPSGTVRCELLRIDRLDLLEQVAHRAAELTDDLDVDATVIGSVS